MAEAIQALWIGRPLSLIERLSITSFLHHGHEYHLYCYEDVGNVPRGAVIRNAGEILPASEIFTYQQGFGSGSVSAFSNLFRYKLLLERGGWWVDTDTVCLRPFDFPEPVLFAGEQMRQGVKVAPGIMRLPAGHPVAAYCWEAAAKADRSTLRWGAIGPDLITRAVVECNVRHLVARPEVFLPIPHWSWDAVLAADPHPALALLTEHTYAIHLWHEQWRRAGRVEMPSIPPTSLFADLLRRFEVAA